MPDNKCHPPLVPVFVLCGDQIDYGPSERTFIVGPDRAITRITTWLAEDATGPIPPGFLSRASQVRFGSEADIGRYTRFAKPQITYTPPTRRHF